MASLHWEVWRFEKFVRDLYRMKAEFARRDELERDAKEFEEAAMRAMTGDVE